MFKYLMCGNINIIVFFFINFMRYYYVIYYINFICGYIFFGIVKMSGKFSVDLIVCYVLF